MAMRTQHLFVDSRFQKFVWGNANAPVQCRQVEGHCVWNFVDAGQQTHGQEKMQKVRTKRGQRGSGTKRGGARQQRSRNDDRDRSTVTIFFANITSFSAHAKAYITQRDDDILMLAETHKNGLETKKMTTELGKLGWQCTASPAMASNRSQFGNVGGVLSGVKKRC